MSCAREIEVATYAATYVDPVGTLRPAYPLPAVPYLKLAAVEDPASDAITLFALNRDLETPLAVDVSLVGFAPRVLGPAWQLHDDDLAAANTREQPERVVPTPLRAQWLSGDRLRATLAPASWNVIRLERAP